MVRALEGDRRLATRRALEHERGRRAAAERWRLPPVDLPRLRALSPDTLGRAFADQLDAARLDPASLPRKPAPDDAVYVRAHLYETHDIWHVVLGFGTDIAGELGIQAAYVAQLPGTLGPVERIVTVGRRRERRRLTDARAAP